jgi:exopolysaccharide biosynthesis polyprenyl glycosylphosphotransferase
MFRRFSVNFALFSMGIDTCLIMLQLFVATILRPFYAFIPFAAHYPEIIPTPLIIYPVFALEWVAILLLFNVYDGKRNLKAFDEFVSLSLGSLLALVALSGSLYLSYREISRLLFGTFILLAFISMIVWRSVFRYLMERNRKYWNVNRRVLIIGAGPVGRELETRINENPQLGLEVIGFLDDSQEKIDQYQEVLSPLSDAKNIIEDYQIDDAVIALPQRAYKRTNQLVGELHRMAVKVWVIPDYFSISLHKAAIDEFAGIPMLDLRAPALSDYQRMTKRAFDLVVSILSLPFILPIMAIIALFIYFEKPKGPILLRQERAGENGKIFQMLKFRTMLPNAEELRHLVEKRDINGNIIHKIIDDPRVTRVGRFLRRTSLDELPQIFNVLKGDMSLVGPRPELPYLVDEYKTWQRQRFAVPQGITGWWQINGRSDKPMHLNTEDDLYYVQNYSIFLDLLILFRTIQAVVSSKGAF